ncbi:MAG: phosphate ABC transporter permease [Candidatus Hadarchaeum yellowstonense]|jgi:phosphate transport system permease protein|uniref:Phosphate transport system permease protein n=1 Tax=Hadarchaeum yellowstonense TaxID=1776334 RepID=A0A147K057_HADYE|nr:MAG: phosphate ABC transporter permease [Candidatus Hadarchaeum yellowstonense]TDA30365.1 MAG: phosphate ABC transporter permease subunit PstC [Hadesarchaea archaeon]
MKEKIRLKLSGKILTFPPASVSILAVFFIFIFVFSQGLPLFSKISPFNFFFNSTWRPTATPPSFGIVPLFLGSLLVTSLALLISVPLGLLGAIYIAEIANPKIKEQIKLTVEVLSGIPSVVYGFFGLRVLVPLVQKTFGLPTGETALTGGIVLSIMILPTILSLSEEAISSVPVEYKEASLAIGATKWRTIRSVTIPAAASGITAAIILGLGRAFGETIAVMMVTGGAPIIPTSIFSPVRTMTQTIAAEMGEAVFGSTHYNALFALGIVLFTVNLILNLLAIRLIKKKKW